MSCAGTPSVMVTTSRMPASAASMMASAQNGAGTRIRLAAAPVFATASFTVLKTGRPRCSLPPFPGVTPPTTLVPYAIISLAWKVPLSPVKPWTMTRVFSSSRMLMRASLSWRSQSSPAVPPLRNGEGVRGRGPPRRHDLLGGFRECMGRENRQAALGEDAPALRHVGACESHDQRDRDLHLAHGLNDALRHPVAAVDPREHVHEDGAHLLVGEHQAERGRDAIGARAPTDVQEVGGLTAGVLDHVHGGHGEPGAVDDAADVPVQRHVVEPVLGGFHLAGIFLGVVAQLGDVAPPEHG